MSNSHCSNDGSSWQSSCLWILSCLTYIFPTLPPTMLTLFFTMWPDPFGPFISPFWAQDHIFQRKSLYCLPWLWISYIPLLLHRRLLWQWRWPSSWQCLCQNPQFLYVKNNMWVLHFTKVSEWLISQLHPWLKARLLVCKTTISLFTDTDS